MNQIERLLQLKARWREIALLTAILLLAAFLRVYDLDQLPPGLHYDEAFNATMAHRVLTGSERPIFFTEDMTEEPLAIYVTALSFAVFGETPWAIRLVSALAGIITIAALYALARAMFRPIPQPPSPPGKGARGLGLSPAALAAFTLAILYWHVNFSRLGMEPIFVPLMMTLAFAFLWRALHRVIASEVKQHLHRTQVQVSPSRKLGIVSSHPSTRSARSGSLLAMTDWILAGIFLAATLYTYKAAFFAPILFAVFIGLEILLNRNFGTQNGRGLIILVIVAVLVFSPLGLYLATHPEQFLERPGAVTVASSENAMLADNALKVAGMFFLHGDDNPRSNLPGRPALDPFLAIGFIAGIIACIARIRQRESRFLLLWLVVMVLPSALTDFAPHFGRSIGVTPALALIVAYGFATIVEKAQTARRGLLFTVYGLLFTGLAFSTFTTARDYFQVWGTRAGLFDSFDVGYLTLAEKLRDRPASEAIYLSPVDKDYYTIQFGLAWRDARSFDGRRVLVVPPPGVTATYGIVTRDDPRTIARLGKIFPDAHTLAIIGDYTGKAYATIYRVEGAARIAPQAIVHARFGDAIELIGYDRARDGDTIVLTVYWGCLAETREDYTVFAHLIGVLNPATQSPVWAQDDTRPGRGTFPTARWQSDEVIVDEYRLTPPPNTPRGKYQIEIGMYNLATGARVRIIDANGAPMESNSVIFERIPFP